VLLLATWEGLTPTEIAAVIGVPPATARTRLHRARGRLRAALEPSAVLAPMQDGGTR
jgi:RNA polymerase sigma-70 factor (ECF subfamily)